MRERGSGSERESQDERVSRSEREGKGVYVGGDVRADSEGDGKMM